LDSLPSPAPPPPAPPPASLYYCPLLILFTSVTRDYSYASLTPTESDAGHGTRRVSTTLNGIELGRVRLDQKQLALGSGAVDLRGKVPPTLLPLIVLEQKRHFHL